MLRGCWLLTDLDGTLVSTPHNAKGEYLALDRGPCFPSIRRWLSNGGNMCVITTADRRVFDQVYVPLRSYLKSKSVAGLGQEEQCTSSGNVLLSLYTGAVMYGCSERGVQDEHGYSSSFFCGSSACSSKLSREQPQPLQGEAVCGTCLSASQADVVCDIVASAFVDYASAVLYGDAEAVASQHWLSLRYQRLWANLLKFLEKKYQAAAAKAKNKGEAAEDPVRWKIDYLGKRKQMLAAIGIIRKEREYTSEEINAVYAKGVCEDGKTEFSRETATSFDQLDQAHHLGVGGRARHVVAQVIVVGMPLRLYSRFFKQHEESFRRLGVTPIAQPNSVVFSRSGVSKSTAVQYLNQLYTTERVSAINEQESGTFGKFRGCLDLQRCVALGDNPNAADHELTIFPSLRFVSCEHHKQRSKRHHDIEAALQQQASTAASNTKQHSSSSRQVWDDRAHSNIEYVGGEERGTSLFLTYLMDQLKVPTDGLDSKPPLSRGGNDDQEGCLAVTNEDFQAAVTDACHRARNDVHNLTLLAPSKI